MKIAKTGDTYPIICANDYRDRIYTIDYILSAAKTAGYNSVMLLHTMWNHEREFYVIAYIDVIKDNNDIYLYDRQRSGSSILDAGAYMGLTNLNYSNPMVSTSESSDGLQSRGSWTFISTTYQNRTYYGTNYDTYEPIFYTDMSYCNIYINNVKVDMNKSGGAGSGYIGNPLLSNKKMVGYNVPASSDESTKTESVEDAKIKATSGKPKIGNGYARITLLQEIIPNPPDEWKTEVEALKDFEIDGKKFINSDIPAGFDGDGFTNKGDYTYVCVASSTNWQSSFNFSHIATIRVTTNSGGGYDIAYENLDHVYMRFQSHISMYGFGMCQLRTGSIDPYYFWPYNSITWQQSYEMATSQTHFDNLTNLFKYLNVHYRNVNLFVDGECWALAG